MQHNARMDANKLYVVTAISNPVRYASRYKLYFEFEKRMRDAGVTLITVEVQLGDRPFCVTERDNVNHVQLRTWSEIWHKENALNIGVQHLSQIHPDWEYVGWFDADISFANPAWATETIQALQHHMLVQPWSHTLDLKPDFAPCEWFYKTGKETLKPASWGYCHVNGVPMANTDLGKSLANGGKMDRSCDGYGEQGGTYYWHPGFAWAARREAWDHLGGLIDYSILGAADYIMGAALTGKGEVGLASWMHPNYVRWIKQWKDRADKYIQGDVGYVPGLLLHYWHGKKAQRGYKDRWRIFHDHGFDPELDLKRDSQGLYQLTDRSPGLRDGCRAYFRQRNEDSVDC